LKELSLGGARTILEREGDLSRISVKIQTCKISVGGQKLAARQKRVAEILEGLDRDKGTRFRAGEVEKGGTFHN